MLPVIFCTNNYLNIVQVKTITSGVDFYKINLMFFKNSGLMKQSSKGYTELCRIKRNNKYKKEGLLINGFLVKL